MIDSLELWRVRLELADRAADPDPLMVREGERPSAFAFSRKEVEVYVAIRPSWNMAEDAERAAYDLVIGEGVDLKNWWPVVNSMERIGAVGVRKEENDG